MSSFSAPLGTLGVAITGDTSGLESALGEIEKKFAGIEAAGSALAGVGAAMTAGITVPIAGIGAAAVKVAEDLNIARASFTTMLGSAEAADKMLKDLQAFAAQTPFEFPDLVASAKNMKAMGFEASQVIPTLKTVGDTAAALGGGKDVIDSITRALGQMQSKGKVSAEEMQQLAERGVPAWKILADQIGVSIPQAMKLAEKGAIQASTAIPALLAGMNQQFGGQMEKMSATLTGQWSNLKDTLTAALIPIGQAIIPALQKLMPILQSVVGAIGEAAKWFQDLPGPLQAAAGAVVAFVAAIGPIAGIAGGIMVAIGSLSAALAPMGLTIAGVTAAIAPWVLAIGAALAALTALGVWVYDNWEPITAVLTQAWEGIKENWTYVWNAISGYITGVWNSIAGVAQKVWKPIAEFFLSVWDAVAPYFTKAWNAIAGTLTGVWNGIKSVATKVWNAIGEAIASFLKWAEKIPGVGKLMNLDDTWKSAQKTATELNKTADATKKVGDEAAKTAPKIKIASDENDKAMKKAAHLAELYRDAWDAAHKRADEQAKEFQKTLKWFEDAYRKLAELDKEVAKSSADLATDYAKAHEAMRQETLKTVEITVSLQKRIPPEIQAVIDKQTELAEAYKTAGVTSTDELNRQWKELSDAYEKIVEANGEMSYEAGRAWIAMEEARVKATIAANGIITEEQKKMLEKMKELYPDLEAKTKEHHKRSRSMWEEWARGVQDIAGRFLSDVVGRLIFGGDDTNKRLDAEAEELRASLAEREQEWNDYAAEVAEKQKELTEEYIQAIADEEQALSDSLAERAREHEETVTKENESYAREMTELDEALAERVQAYEDYEQEVSEHLEEFSREQSERLERETRDLLDQLQERTEDYNDWVSDANKAMNRLGEKTADNIEDETRDVSRNISDRKKDYGRYAEDVARKIAELRQKNNGQNSAEEEDLRRSLARRKEDLDQYIAEQQEDLAEYIGEQKLHLAQEEEDNKTSMDRRARDHEQYIAGVKTKFAENEANYKASLANEETSAAESLAKRKGELDQYVTDTNAKRDEITAAHKTALTTEETDYNTFVTNATTASETRKNNIKAHFEAETADLNTELGKQKQAYDDFVTDITGEGGKLDQLKEKHRTAWSDIADMGKGALGAITQSFLDMASDELMKSVFDKLKGEKGFGGLKDAIEGISGVVKRIFGKGGEIEEGAKNASDALGGVGGSGGEGGGGIPGGGGAGLTDPISGLITAAASVVSAISNVIQNFQLAKIETTLNAIEESTRYTKIWVGEQSWNILENTQHIRGHLADILDIHRQVIPTLREIREAVKNAFTVNLTLGPGDQQSALLGSLIERVGHFDTTATDRLLDLHTAVGKTTEAVQAAGRDIVEAVGLASPAKANESFLEKLFGGGLLGSGGILGDLLGLGGKGAGAAIGAAGGGMSGIFNSRQEGTLNQIERNTAAGSIHLKNTLDEAVKYWPQINSIQSWVWDTFTPAFASLMSTTEDMLTAIRRTNEHLRDWLKPIYDDTFGKWKLYEDRLYEISDHGFWIGQDVSKIQLAVADMKGYLETVRNSTSAMKDQMTGAKTWTVQFTGDPIARMVGDEIMRQLRMQGVNLV